MNQNTSNNGKRAKDKPSNLEIPVENLPTITTAHRQEYRRCNKHVKNAAKYQAALGLMLILIRDKGLWRCSKRPIFNSFAEYYKFYHYETAQVCRLMAEATLLAHLADKFPGVNPFHVRILLRAVRDKKDREQVDLALAEDIYRSVLKTSENGRVTGAAILEELVERKLIAAPAPKDDQMEIVDEVVILDDDQDTEVPAASVNESLALIRQAKVLASEIASEIDDELLERFELLCQLLANAETKIS